MTFMKQAPTVRRVDVLLNHNEDCDEFEFQIVMVLQDSLSHSLVLLTLEALKCLFFPHPMIHLGLCRLIL